MNALESHKRVLDFLQVSYKQDTDHEGGRHYLSFYDAEDPKLREEECVLGFDTDTGESVSIEFFP